MVVLSNQIDLLMHSRNKNKIVCWNKRGHTNNDVAEKNYFYTIFSVL